MSEQLMEFKVEDKKLKMEIKISDLIRLFETSEANFDGEDKIAKIKKDKKEEFVQYIIDYLKDMNRNNENLTNWDAMFEQCFYEIVEGYEDFCIYKEA